VQGADLRQESVDSSKRCTQRLQQARHAGGKSACTDTR
jgi:hypothetical protein